MKVLSIDPGGTTGWKIITASLLGALEWKDIAWRHGQIGPHEHHTDLWDFLSAEKTEDLIVILEGFDNRGNPAAVLISLEYIGVVRLWCKLNNVTCVMQQPAEMKWATDKKLRACKIYVPGQRHSNDAGRHILIWLVFERHFMPVLKLLKENL